MEKEVYKVTYHITGPDYSKDDRPMSSEVYDAVVVFSCNPKQYGNGYSMGIKSKAEPFGIQGYDIRYDTDFNKLPRIVWLAQFYANRYDGKDGRWELLGIRIHVADEQEGQDI